MFRLSWFFLFLLVLPSAIVEDKELISIMKNATFSLVLVLFIDAAVSHLGKQETVILIWISEWISLFKRGQAHCQGCPRLQICKGADVLVIQAYPHITASERCWGRNRTNPPHSLPLGEGETGLLIKFPRDRPLPVSTGPNAVGRSQRHWSNAPPAEKWKINITQPNKQEHYFLRSSLKTFPRRHLVTTKPSSQQEIDSKGEGTWKSPQEAVSCQQTKIWSVPFNSTKL